MGKSIKDSNAPKRPLSAYFQWQNQNRTRIIKSMPVGHSFKQLSQAFAKEWKSLSEEDKKPFADTWKIESERYKKLNNAYKLTANYKNFQKTKAAAKVKDVKSTKFKKDPNAPKKAMTGYFLFLGEKRDSVGTDYPDLTYKEGIKKLGAMWGEMSDADKKVYQDKAAAAKKVYDAEFEKYKQTAEYKSYQAEKAEWQKAKKTKLKMVKKRALAQEEGDDEDRPVKRAKRSKTKSPKKSKKKSKKKSGKPKAPKAKAKKSRKGKKSRKAKKGVRKSKKSKSS